MIKKILITIILVIMSTIALSAISVYAEDIEVTLYAGKSYEIVNTSTKSIDIKNNSSDRARYDYVKYYVDNTYYYNQNSYGSISLSDRGEWRITLGELYDMQCYLPYELYGSEITVTQTTMPA